MATILKNEVINGGAPMPQRNQKNQNKNKLNQPTGPNQLKSDIGEGAPIDKKPRFSGNQGNGGGGGGGNNYRQGGRNFGNRGGRNRDRSKNAKNEQIKSEEQSIHQGVGDVGNFNRNMGGGDRDRGDRGGNDRRMGGVGGSANRSGGGGGGGAGNRSGGGGGGGGGFGRGDDFFIAQRLRAISGPSHELPPIEADEGKFSGRNRLYIGNLTNDANEEELREMFKPYGEIGEIFANSEKNFAFLKVDYHANAEKAKRDLDGSMRKGRNLRVRFAPNATILRVKNLSQWVSNELLYKSFEIFGPIERAVVIVDDRGKHTGEGIVEFAKKSSANACLRLCAEKCFFLTASLRPCVVEQFDINDDNDGLPDKSLNKKTQEFHQERSIGPRFAEHDSFEHEYGTRWKQLYELFKTKQEALKRELKMEEEKLEAQMEYARYEHETELLRQELRKREQDNERKKIEWEMREKQAEELKQRDEENLRRQQSEMQSRMIRQEEEMRRRQQENTLFMQAQQLNSLLDQQEGKQGGNITPNCVSNSGGNNFDNFDQLNQNNTPFDFRDALSVFAGNSMGGNNGPNNTQDQFPFEFGGNNQQSQGGQNRGGNNSGNNNKPWERRRRF